MEVSLSRLGRDVRAALLKEVNGTTRLVLDGVDQCKTEQKQLKKMDARDHFNASLKIQMAVVMVVVVL